MFEKLFLSSGKESLKLSEINDPFQQKHIEKIFIFIRPKTIFGDKSDKPFSATIYFKNKGTSGEQELEEKTFESLIQRLNALINSL